MCVVARGLHDNTPSQPFHVLMVNLSDSPVHLALNMVLAVADDVPSMLVSTADSFSDSEVSDTPPLESEDAFIQEGEGQAQKSATIPQPGPVYIRPGTADTRQRRSVIRAKTVNWKEAVTHKPKEAENWREKVRLGTNFESYRPRIESLLEPFADMWNGQLGALKATEHRIELLPDSKPVHQPPYRAGPLQREMEKKEIDSMLAKGVIEPATTDWASPIVFVPKPDGSLRFCVDYRRLNALTIRDSYPIPRMDECIDSLGEAVIFSTLDCNSGYWQIPVAQEDKDKTAFISHYGLYRWLRMPFGLKNAPGTFQRAADIILASVKWQFALVYLDDIIVYSKSIEEHLDHLASVLKLLQRAGLNTQAAEVSFLQRLCRLSWTYRQPREARDI